MKKLFLVECVFIMLFAVSTVWATPIIGPWNYTGADSILGYDFIHPSNEDDELAFANAVLAGLGLSATTLAGGTGLRYTYPEPSPKNDVLNPGFAWTYAVVKVDGPNDYCYLFVDDYLTGGDDILQTPIAGISPFNMKTPPKGISHVTWFGGGIQVPEPSTMLLFGIGLIVLAGFRRKIKK